MKRCARCSKLLPLAEFHLHPKTVDRRQSRCKACVREASAQWYRDNQERRKAMAAAQREANANYLREQRAVKRATDIEAARARDRAAWAKRMAKNPEVLRARLRRVMSMRRARIAGGVVVPFTQAQLDAKMAYWGNRCWLCGTENWTDVDHVKPVAAGGPHILANLRPTCHPCNASKGGTWPYPAVFARLGITAGRGD